MTPAPTVEHDLVEGVGAQLLKEPRHVPITARLWQA